MNIFHLFHFVFKFSPVFGLPRRQISSLGHWFKFICPFQKIITSKIFFNLYNFDFYEIFLQLYFRISRHIVHIVTSAAYCTKSVLTICISFSLASQQLLLAQLVFAILYIYPCLYIYLSPRYSDSSANSTWKQQCEQQQQRGGKQQ